MGEDSRTLMTRHTKQFLYGSGFLAFFALVALGVYFFFVRPAPSCFDTRQNQNEEGIDCGGVCAKDCLVDTLRLIEISGTPEFFTLPGGRMSALVEIQNPNLSHGAKNVLYRVAFTGENREVIAESFGETFIYPGESKYLFFPDVQAGASAVRDVELSVKEITWARAEAFRKPQISVQNHRTLPEDRTVRVEGAVLNQDTVALPAVRVLAVFYDTKFGLSVGASETVLDDVAPGESRAFAILHPPIGEENQSLDVNATKVFVSAYKP